jgi:hypothetical protein
MAETFETGVCHNCHVVRYYNGLLVRRILVRLFLGSLLGWVKPAQIGTHILKRGLKNYKGHRPFWYNKSMYFMYGSRALVEAS